MPFLGYAADILADTTHGLSGNAIVKFFNAYAVEHNIDIPHATYPFEAPNKRTALLENLKAFPSPLQYKIISALCEHASFSLKRYDGPKSLKVKLVSQFAHLAPKDEFSKLNETLTEETRHWLDRFPDALNLYLQAIHKYRHGIFSRNLLDDLRLSLELLMKEVFSNDKSLENQLNNVGQFVSNAGGSKEFSNMFSKLMDYYAKYQNSYIKHDDAVVEEEVEFVFEITSSFMRHIIRLDAKTSTA
ncbi:hypothetical protein SAMN05414139_02934 [Burkholderia sp. D7]|nr:hypothetical protein SAMN05414139_02934 [Burkholderia sp. D7]